MITRSSNIAGMSSQRQEPLQAFTTDSQEAAGSTLTGTSSSTDKSDTSQENRQLQQMEEFFTSSGLTTGEPLRELLLQLAQQSAAKSSRTSASQGTSTYDAMEAMDSI